MINIYYSIFIYNLYYILLLFLEKFSKTNIELVLENGIILQNSVLSINATFPLLLL